MYIIFLVEAYISDIMIYWLKIFVFKHMGSLLLKILLSFPKYFLTLLDLSVDFTYLVSV